MTLKSTMSFAVAVVLSLLLSIPFAKPAGAQSANPPANGVEKGKTTNGPRKQLATIVFAGLGGAVLGLSTLSFYGRPQENLRNIAIGAAFGVIAGTMMVTYKAATNPAELYGAQRTIEDGFESTSLSKNASRNAVAPPSPLRLNLAFDF